MPVLRAPCGQGLVLALLNLAFATVVAVSTYYLNVLANTHVGLGLNVETFTSNQFNIPVNVLLQGSVTLPLATPLPVDATLSLSTLLYKGCSKKDVACASAFLPATNHLWSAVAKTFVNISNFEQPLFQDSAQTVTIQHINNLAAWNKPTAQISIVGHAMAITCMVRRARFYLASSSPSSAEIDSIAFCSPRKFDPNWICENQVATDAPSYAIQVSRGAATYLGVAPRHDIYMNPGYLATFTGSPLGAVRLGPVPAIDEFEGGILQIMAPWDVVPFGDCANLNPSTGLGWLMQMAGFVTITIGRAFDQIPAFATFTNGHLGSVLLQTVRAIDEYQGGILQLRAPWDVLPACSCLGTLDE
ncbi:hypothetical protein SDRG_01299 [Saprolegnia diclina VS20]|uniref:Uncharacterized protein n=1 Tax=Saprolegnia diclina (strain VS20) TaxID=1156394 RepID=T0R4M7_SAPDV|nr:hypothetical protein SDRG_01299 [Saprolegnia diclina VS20]EQC41325.1 hypothetical protein SDRG_01299 [Saprolegnia diclina VS20]|eukprot:XP_008605039.1 hypothetical protein SDRG_01299 [Saprolegnia diclina VS20]